MSEKEWGYWLDQPGGTWIMLPKLPLTRAGYTQPPFTVTRPAVGHPPGGTRMSLHPKHTPPAYIDRMLNSPKAIRYRLPHLHDRARQDLAAGDTLAYQRTMIRLADTEREIARQDQILEKALQAEQ